MTDVFSKRKRSLVMSGIRSRGNRSTEMRLISLLRENGISGWRRGYPLVGKPDFVFPKVKQAVFVDGCFWHGCPAHYREPRGNAAFWREKIARNRQRDKSVGRELRRRGWKVLRIWEHELRNPQSRSKAALRLMRSLRGA